MRKIVCCVLCAGILLPLTAAVGCSSPRKRDGYVMNLEYLPEERKLTAEATLTLSNRTDTELGELKFQLWANAYREGAKYAPVSQLYESKAYYNGKSYGGITIASVTGGTFAVTGEDANILTVKPSSPLYPDEQITLGMQFEVDLAQINHRLGVGEHNVNLAHFYPIPCFYGQSGYEEYVYTPTGDPFVNECMDFDVTLTVPENYTAVYNGTGECVAQNGKKAYHIIAENVRDTAIVLGTELKSVTATADGVPVEYYYFSDAAPEASLKAATESLAYYAKTFGAYTYPRYTVVETDFPYGGMEYSGMAMIASDLSSTEIPTVIAHETAHQWWYGMVGSNQYCSSWQDEGLAEFSTALFFGAHPSYGVTYENAVAASEKSYRAFFSVYSQINGEANTKMNRPLTSFTGDYEYRNIAYDKGVILFSRLKSVLGEKKFFAGLKRYAEQYRGKLATQENMISCFTAAGGNAEGVFTSFTEGLCVI